MVCVFQKIVKILTWKDLHWGTVAFLKSVGGFGVIFFKCGGEGANSRDARKLCSWSSCKLHWVIHNRIRILCGKVKYRNNYLITDSILWKNIWAVLKLQILYRNKKCLRLNAFNFGKASFQKLGMIEQYNQSILEYMRHSPLSLYLIADTHTL